MSEAVQDLPTGWCNSTLAAIATPRTGKANPQEFPDAQFIGMEQVEAHTMRLLGTVAARSMRSSANTFRPSDVLYGRLRAYLNKVYQPDFAGLCSGEFIVLPENQALHGRFLKYRLNAADFVNFASHLNTGDRPRVDWDQVKTFGVNLPPRPEQERIADALDELLSDLDAGVAALERAREKLKLYRASVLKAGVEGALTAEWRAQHPEAEPASGLLQRILVERRRRWEEAQIKKFKEAGKPPPKNWKAKYKEPVAPDTTNLSKLPEGWYWASIDQLISAAICNGISVRGADSPPGIAALRLNAMSDRGFDYSKRRYLPLEPEDVDDLWIQKGDFFVCRGNGSKELVGRGTLAQEPGERIIFPDTMMRLRFGKAIQVTGWVSAVWSSLLVRSQIERAAKTTAGIYKISQPDLANMVVPLPPETEQSVVVQAVEEQLSTVNHLEADLDTKLKSAQALRQSILRDAFAGKLVPQDPNDEPASVLLERIATEREQRERRMKAAKKSRSTVTHKRARKNKGTTIT